MSNSSSKIMFGESIFEDALRLYAGPHIVERVRKNKHAALKRSCEEIDLVLLAQDIKPFTSFSTSLTYAHLQEMMCEYLDRMTDCIEQCDGVIDHIRGDFVFAYWESLSASPVLAVVKRANEIGNEISAKWAKFLPEPIIPVHGVDVGRVMRGNFGSKSRMNFSVLGDNVNFTMRLCSMNNSFQTRSLISSRVRSLAGEAAELRLVENVVVKGRVEKEALYTLDAANPL